MQVDHICHRNSSLLTTRRYQELFPTPLFQIMCGYQYLYVLLFLLQPFFTVDSDVQWPEWSSCEAEFGPGGETVIRSEEGRAVLVLSPSGEEFSIKFTCGLSQTQDQRHSVQCFSTDPVETGRRQKVSSPICQTTCDETKKAYEGRRSRKNETIIRSRSCSPQINNAAQSKVIEF